jgi:pimeloyl-ACP methyl ester carboxylesterase
MIGAGRLALACFGFCLAAAASAAPAGAVKNIVLVHGAFADGSGWQAISDILEKDGYKVSIVQPPETSLDDDIAATNRTLDLLDGPAVLVGHSYGGMIISGAGNNAHVKTLVYVAAFQPDEGESLGSLQQKTPPAGAAAVKPTSDGFLYLDPAQFHAEFAADLPKKETDFMARSQVFLSTKSAGSPAKSPAWKTKPSFAVVATEDRSINPELERFMTKRAKSETIELKASHVVYMSKPKEVAALIEKAAQASK